MELLPERLEREARECKDIAEKASLLAEQGCYLARVGSFTKAKEVVRTLRTTPEISSFAKTNIWVIALEGVIHYFEDLSPSSFDRLRRASALSAALGDDRLLAFCNSWIAHFHFNSSRFVEMQEALRTCSARLASERTPVVSRFALTLADAALYSEDFRRAGAWYELARQAAVACGDQATIGALLYNRSALEVSRLRYVRVLRPLTPDELSFAQIAAESASNFQTGTRTTSLSQLLALTKARLLLLQSSFTASTEALRKIDKELSDGERERVGTAVKLDLCFALHMCGSIIESRQEFKGLDPNKINALDPEDRIVAYGQLDLLASRDNEFYSSTRPAIDLVEHATAEYNARRRALLDVVQSFDADYNGPYLAKFRSRPVCL